MVGYRHAEARLPAPDFAKIDVEGYERCVLEGMRETIERHHPHPFIELHGATPRAKRANAKAVTEFLLAASYEIRHDQTGQWITNAAEAPPEGHLPCC